jgi:thiol-disulfide isomerase/thioredoxin
VNRDWRLPLLVFGLALMAAGAGLLASRWWFGPPTTDAAPAAAGEVALGERRPALRLPGLDGRLQDLAQFDGRPLLINYWATWCPPCIEELPRLVDLHARRADDGVAVLAIALEHDAAAVGAWLREHAIELPVWVETPGPGDSSARLGNRRGVLPFSVLLDADGRLVRRKAGLLSAAELAEWAGDVR